MRIGCLLLYEDAAVAPSETNKQLSGPKCKLPQAVTMLLEADQLEIDEVVIVNTLERASAILNSRCVDAILIHLAIGTSPAFKDIQKIRDTTATSIILLSNVYSDELIASCLKAGADDFLFAPELNESSIRDAIMKSVSRRQMRECGMRIDSKINQLSQMAGVR